MVYSFKTRNEDQPAEQTLTHNIMTTKKKDHQLPNNQFVIEFENALAITSHRTLGSILLSSRD
jgi:hypothetical protein